MGKSNFVYKLFAIFLICGLMCVSIPTTAVHAQTGETMYVSKWSAQSQLAVSGRPTVIYDGTNYHLWYGSSDTTLYHSVSASPTGFATGTLATFDTAPAEVASPAIILENGVFYMFAYGSTNKTFAIYTSSDGTAWTFKGNVFDGTGLDINNPGWIKIDCPSIISDNGSYKLYFQLKPSDASSYAIFAATSGNTTLAQMADGDADNDFTLANSNSPVITKGAAGGPETDRVMQPTVVKDGSNYFMWYVGVSGVNNVNLATSTDGITWKKASGNPVFTDPGLIYEPTVVKVGNTWNMWTMKDNQHIYYVSSNGPFQFSSIQEGIDAANAGDTISVYPGSYDETAPNKYLYNNTGPYQFGLFFPASKPGLILQGVHSDGTPITSYSDPELPYVTTNATNNFGSSGFFVEGDNVTITGLKIGPNKPEDNKTVEVIGDNFTFKYNVISVPDQGGSLYLDDWRYNEATSTSYVKSYTIEGNFFQYNSSIDIASGAGYSGDVSGRKIINNLFDAQYSDGITTGEWATISFNGHCPSVGWFVDPVGGAVITGNTFKNGTQYIRTRCIADDSQFNWVSYFGQNTFDTAVINGPDPLIGDVSAYSYNSFTDVRRIGGSLQSAIDIALPNDVIIVKGALPSVAGGYNINRPHLTIEIPDGTVIKNESPCFTINASYTKITTESIGGATCIPTNGANGIDVAKDLTNVIIQGLEIDGSQTGGTSADGIHFAGAITDVQIVDNYIHGLPGNGLTFTSTPTGVVTVQGNLFKDNTGVGVSSPSNIDVTYNSWGSYDGATSGDGVFGITSTTPYTHVDVSMASSGTPWANLVLPATEIKYTVSGNFQNAMGAAFDLAYPTSLLKIESVTPTTTFSTPATGESVVDFTTTPGVISYAAYSTTEVSGAALPLYTVTFSLKAASGHADLIFNTGTDAFSMLPASGGPSNNIYANDLVNGALDVITALPTLSATGLDTTFAQGYEQTFSITVTNPAGGVNYSNLELRFASVPTDAILWYTTDGGTTWTSTTGVVPVGVLNAGASTTVQMKAKFSSAKSYTLTTDLYDTTEVTPDAKLATLSKSITVNANVTVLGTFSMQGRTVRSGILVTLLNQLYGPLTTYSMDVLSNNVEFDNVAKAAYTVTTNQARYLNVTADMGKTIDVTSDTTLNSLELVGGNAYEPDTPTTGDPANTINVGDAGVVGAQYGKSGSSYNGDVNFSGKVDIFDLAIVGGNYLKTGDGVYGGTNWTPQ